MGNRIEARPPVALVRGCGIVALAGCAFVLVTDLLGAHLAGHIGMVSETISNVAAGGRYDWLVDGGLYGFVIAVLAVALGLSRWRIEGWGWAIGRALIVLLAADITAIAAYEAYNRPGGGPDLHLYFVGLLGIGFPVMVWLTAPALARLIDGLKPALRIAAAVWALAGPILYLMPTGWDGLYERALALAMVAWFALAGWLLWRGTKRAA